MGSGQRSVTSSRATAPPWCRWGASELWAVCEQAASQHKPPVSEGERRYGALGRDWLACPGRSLQTVCVKATAETEKKKCNQKSNLHLYYHLVCVCVGGGGGGCEGVAVCVCVCVFVCVCGRGFVLVKRQRWALTSNRREFIPMVLISADKHTRMPCTHAHTHTHTHTHTHRRTHATHAYTHSRLYTPTACSNKLCLPGASHKRAGTVSEGTIPDAHSPSTVMGRLRVCDKLSFWWSELMADPRKPCYNSLSADGLL